MSRESQIALNKLHDELALKIKGMRCAGCKTEPRVAWLQTYKIRCECPIGMTTLEKPNYVEDRRIEMVKPMEPVANPAEDLW